MLKRMIPNGEYSRNVLTLMSGTMIAQAIPIIISPILTRMYTPEDFGIFALYFSVANIIASVSTGRYEMAVMLPDDDRDALNLVILSVIISLFISCISLLLVIFLGSRISILLGNPAIRMCLYLIPFMVFLSGTFQGLNYWNIRKKKYKRMASNRVIQSGTTGTLNAGFGFVSPGGFALAIGGIIGQCASVVNLTISLIKEDHNYFSNISKHNIINNAKRYIDFPRFDVPAVFLNLSAQQLTHIFFNTFFNATIAGYYYLTQRIMGMPMTLIANSILDVFKEEASRAYRKDGNAKYVFIKTFKKLFIISIPIAIFLYIFIEKIFVIVFGVQWQIAGEFARILVPMFFIRFIASPLSFMLYISEKQKLNVIGQGMLLAALLFSFYFNKSEVGIITSISLSFSIIYFYYLIISAKIAHVF